MNKGAPLDKTNRTACF